MSKITEDQARAIKSRFKRITDTPNQFFNEVADDLGVHPTTIRRICLPRGKKQKRHKIKKRGAQTPGRWYTTVLVGTAVLGWQYLGWLHEGEPRAAEPPFFWWDRDRCQYMCQPDEYGARRFEPYTRADDIIHLWQKMMRPHTRQAFCKCLMKLSSSSPLDLSQVTPKMVCEAALLVRGYQTHDQFDESYQAMGDKS